MPTYRFRAVGTGLAQHWDKFDQGVKCFIGRRLDPESGGFVPAEPTEVSSDSPYIGEYRKQVLGGEIAPADAETAAAFGLPWTDESAKPPRGKPKES